MAKQDILVQTEQDAPTTENLTNAKVKASSGSSKGERTDYQKELSNREKPRTVSEGVRETNRRIEDDVILHSGTTAKQSATDTDNQRRVVEATQINQGTTTPTAKKKRRLGSRISLRLAKSGLAKFIKFDDELEDIQEDVRGNSDNLAAIEAAEKELATRLEGTQIAELVTSQNNEIDTALELLEQQSLSEKQIKLVNQKYEKIAKLAKHLAAIRYNHNGIDEKKLQNLEESKNKELTELDKIFSKHPFLEEPFLEAKQEVEDYYALKSIQEKIYEIARRKAYYDSIQYLHHAKNSESSRREWSEFEAEITIDILHRRPELTAVIDEIWNDAYEYEYEIFEQGKKGAELIYSELKEGKNCDRICSTLRKLNFKSFLSMEVHYKRITGGNHLTMDFEDKLSNYKNLVFHTGNRDAVLRTVRSVEHRKAKDYEGIDIDSHFSIKLKKEELEKRIKVKTFSLEASQLVLAIRGKLSFCDALISLSARSEFSRNQLKSELKQVYGDKFTGLSKSRKILLEKAFKGIEISKEELVELALQEYGDKGALHGQLLAAPEFVSGELSLNITSLERDFSRLTDSNPQLRQIFIEAYLRASSDARSQEILIVYQKLLDDESRLEGINGSDVLKQADDTRQKQRIYIASQQSFINTNPKLIKKIELTKTKHESKFLKAKRKLGRAARNIYGAGSNYNKVHAILSSLNADELKEVAIVFKDYGCSLEQYIAKKHSDRGMLGGITNHRSNLLKLVQKARKVSTETPTKNESIQIEIDYELTEAAKECANGKSLKSDLLLLKSTIEHPLGAMRLKETFSNLSKEQRKLVIQEFNKRFGSISEFIKEKYDNHGQKIALACINGEEINANDIDLHIQRLLKRYTNQYAHCKASKQHIGTNELLIQIDEIVSYGKDKDTQDKLLEEFHLGVSKGHSEFILQQLVRNAYRRGIEEGKSTLHIDKNNLKKLEKRRKEILNEHKTFLKAQPIGLMLQIEKQEEKAFEQGVNLATACHRKVINMNFACNGNGGAGTDEDKLFANMRHGSLEERALLQELYKLKVGHSLQYELYDELGGYYLDKGEALMRGDRVGELAAEAALALNTWWGMNPDEGRTIRALEELQTENLKNENVDLRADFLELFNAAYAPDFSKNTFKKVTDLSFNEEEQAVGKELLKGDPRSVAVARLKFAEKEKLAVELEKIILDPLTGEISKKSLEKLHKDLGLSENETVEDWVKGRFKEQSTFTVWNFEYNYMKWALALVDGKAHGNLRARAHKLNYAIKGMGTTEHFIEEACSGSQQLVLTLKQNPENNVAKEKLKADAKFIKEFYKKEYGESGNTRDALRSDLNGDMNGILAEVEIFRLENGYLDQINELRYAIGNEDLKATMSIIRGKTESELKILEKELLASTNAKGMFTGEYNSLEELIKAHFYKSDENQLVIELIGLPESIPSGKLTQEDKKALEQVGKLIEARYENARMGFDIISNTMTSTGVELDQETDEIRRILLIAEKENKLSQEQADRLEILIKRQVMLSTSHLEEAESLGELASNYAAGAVIVVGVVGTSIFTGGAAVPFWIGVGVSAGASLAARQGTRAMIVGNNTFSGDTMLYDGGMASLDGLTFGAGSVITGKIANRVYTTVGQRALALESKFITETAKKPTANLLGQSIVEKTFKRRVAMRSLEGMTEGSLTGYLHSASVTALDETTWENGLLNGFMIVNQNGTIGGASGLGMGGTLAIPFAIVKPPVVKMSQQISPEKAMSGGILERIGIEDTWINNIGRKIGISRNKMSKTDATKALETKGIITRGDVEIARLNGRKLSDKQANKLLKKANKLLKKNEITLEQVDNIKKLNEEGALTELHLAEFNGVAPTYVVDVNPNVLKVRQIKLNESGYDIKVAGANSSDVITSKTKDINNLKTKKKETSAETVIQSEVESKPIVKSDKEFLDILTERGITDELKGFIKKGQIKNIKELDTYLASPMGLDQDKNIVDIVKRLNKNGNLRNSSSAKRNDSIGDDGGSNKVSVTDNYGGSGDGAKPDYGNYEYGSKADNSLKEGAEDSAVMLMDDVAKEEQALSELFETKSNQVTKKSKEKGVSNESNYRGNTTVKNDKNLEANRPLTEEESLALDALVRDKKALSDFEELGGIIGGKKINDSYITAYELEDFINSRLITADDLPEPLKAFAIKRFKSEKIGSNSENLPNGKQASSSKEIDGEELEKKLQEIKKRVKKVQEAKKNTYEQIEKNEFDLELAYKDSNSTTKENELSDISELNSKLNRTGTEVRRNNNNKDELDPRSLQERNQEIDRALDDISKALDKEEAGFTTDLFETSSSYGNEAPLFNDGDSGGGAGVASKKKQSELQAVAERVSDKLSKSKEIRPKIAKPKTESSSSTASKVETAKPKLTTEFETPAPRLILDNEIALQLSLRTGLQTSIRHGLKHSNSKVNQNAKQKSPAPAKEGVIPSDATHTLKTKTEDPRRGRKPKPDPDITSNPTKEEQKKLLEIQKRKREENLNKQKNAEKKAKEHDPSQVRYKIVTIKGNIYRQRFERSTQTSSNDQWVMTHSKFIGKVEDGLLS